MEQKKDLEKGRKTKVRRPFHPLYKLHKPHVIVAENVKRMIKEKFKGYANEILKEFNETGYKVEIFL